MAAITDQPLATIQFIAFCLILIGLVDEVFLPSYTSQNNKIKRIAEKSLGPLLNKNPELEPQLASGNKESLIYNLLGFVRKKFSN